MKNFNSGNFKVDFKIKKAQVSKSNLTFSNELEGRKFWNALDLHDFFINRTFFQPIDINRFSRASI